MVIDMHVHPVFYKDICGDEEELAFREDTFGVWKQGPMSFEEAFAEMDYGKIDKEVLLPLDVSTTAGGYVVTNEQVAKLVELEPDRLIGFASVDPHREDALEVLEKAFTELGMKGLKLNPSKQKFHPMDKDLQPIYELCEKKDKPIIFHAGTSWEPDTPAKYSHPLEFEEIFIRYPDLRCCLAHFAWPWVREMCMLMLKYPNVYTDTSVLYLDSPEESIHRLFTEDMGARWAERAFAKQILFASNTPRFRAFKIRRAIEKLPIIKEVKEDILGGNAVRFLGMEQTYGKA